MLVLALDTATPASTAALMDVTADALRGGAERRTVDPRGHGEKPAPEIAAMPAKVGVRPADLGAIVAGVGPGPFPVDGARDLGPELVKPAEVSDIVTRPGLVDRATGEGTPPSEPRTPLRLRRPGAVHSSGHKPVPA